VVIEKRQSCAGQGPADRDAARCGDAVDPLDADDSGGLGLAVHVVKGYVDSPAASGRLPWREITLDHHDRTRAHHRLEIRRLKTVAFAHLDYPDARQALQVVRWRKDFTSGKLTIERVYLITSLPPGTATGPQLAAWFRGHWKIENLSHHVRDRTFHEDDSKIHVGRLPRIMAGLRNPAISVHRQDGRTNIAAALRYTAR
jgi:hypothetical protein